ncbi:MAG TPA: sulfurtransferase TusA family protein [Candidatus Limiplasma sp.]|nr:sulfurtransferase TusA family protein [Candidatus Limiplasma sp.]HPS80498.1 sulfurtransferase TusA family protein [Candidatus Limiplasma sp.]
MKTVDARGCACPEPVMMTREAMNEDPSHIEVLVSETCAVENITRFASHFGYAIQSKPEGEDTRLILTK